MVRCRDPFLRYLLGCQLNCCYECIKWCQSEPSDPEARLEWIPSPQGVYSYRDAAQLCQARGGRLASYRQLFPYGPCCCCCSEYPGAPEAGRPDEWWVPVRDGNRSCCNNTDDGWAYMNNPCCPCHSACHNRGSLHNRIYMVCCLFPFPGEAWTQPWTLKDQNSFYLLCETGPHVIVPAREDPGSQSRSRDPQPGPHTSIAPEPPPAYSKSDDSAPHRD